MSETRSPTPPSWLRLVKLISIISLPLFTLLLAWQLLVLISGNYPDHILPAVKLLNGTQESVPIAYAWTFRLASITLFGFVTSAVGWLATDRRLKKRWSSSA